MLIGKESTLPDSISICCHSLLQTNNCLFIYVYYNLSAQAPPPPDYCTTCQFKDSHCQKNLVICRDKKVKYIDLCTYNSFVAIPSYCRSLVHNVAPELHTFIASCLSLLRKFLPQKSTQLASQLRGCIVREILNQMPQKHHLWQINWFYNVIRTSCAVTMHTHTHTMVSCACTRCRGNMQTGYYVVCISQQHYSAS